MLCLFRPFLPPSFFMLYHCCCCHVSIVFMNFIFQHCPYWCSWRDYCLIIMQIRPFATFDFIKLMTDCSKNRTEEKRKEKKRRARKKWSVKSKGTKRTKHNTSSTQRVEAPLSGKVCCMLRTRYPLLFMRIVIIS